MDMKVTCLTGSLGHSRDFARMTRAIEFIEREYERQPRLAAIARHVGLSEFHFNRLFRRWTGLTPRQYLAEVTSRAASAALRHEDSVMGAAHAVGLSGAGGYMILRSPSRPRPRAGTGPRAGAGWTRTASARTGGRRGGSET